MLLQGGTVPKIFTAPKKFGFYKKLRKLVQLWVGRSDRVSRSNWVSLIFLGLMAKAVLKNFQTVALIGSQANRLNWPVWFGSLNLAWNVLHTQYTGLGFDLYAQCPLTTNDGRGTNSNRLVKLYIGVNFVLQ